MFERFVRMFVGFRQVSNTSAEASFVLMHSRQCQNSTTSHHSPQRTGQLFFRARAATLAATVVLVICMISGTFSSMEAQAAAPQGGAARSSWLIYFGNHPVSERWSVPFQVQYRRTGIGQRWEQLLVKPGVELKLGEGFSALLAYSYFRQYPFEGGSLGNPSTPGPQPEHSVEEEIDYKQPIIVRGENAIKLTHFVRLQQRFVGTSSAGIGTMSWRFAEFARYRLTADYGSVYDEVFTNVGPHAQRALALNRTYGAFGWQMGRDWQLELGYLHQYSPVPNGVVGVDDDAFQITINSVAPLKRLVRR